MIALSTPVKITQGLKQEKWAELQEAFDLEAN